MARNTPVPWDAQTEDFISTIDQTFTEGELGLRDLLLNPGKYINDKEIQTKIQEMKSAVRSFFDTMLQDLSGEQEKLNKDLEDADAQYKKINDSIKSKSSSAKVPFIKPSYIFVDERTREEIVIDKYGDDVESLVGKLANDANYIADLSTTYKSYNLGSWLFSCGKPIVLSVNAPASMIISIDRSSTLINQMLESIAGSAKILEKTK